MNLTIFNDSLRPRESPVDSRHVEGSLAIFTLEGGEETWWCHNTDHYCGLQLKRLLH